MANDVLGEQFDAYQQVAANFASQVQEGEVEDYPFGTRGGVKAVLHVSQARHRAGMDALCIVSHGYFDSDSPDDSGLLLGCLLGIIKRHIPLSSGGSLMFRDLPFRSVPSELEPRIDAELLTVKELKVDCTTAAQLVALFACNTNPGHSLAGQESSTMAEQWLQLGAVSVLANLWELDLDFITEWAALFLPRWIDQRQPKAIAWREATREWLTRHPQSEPYFWGGITLLGDWL